MKRAYFRNLKLDFGTCLNIILSVIACVVLFSEAKDWLRERSLVLRVGDRVPAMAGIDWARSLSEIEFPQPSIAINSLRDRQILGSK